MIEDLLATSDHRPWPMPQRRWAYYQEWRDVVFLHYQVDQDTLAAFLPRTLQPDLFEESAWISLVAFDMVNVRPWYAPAFSPISDFHEVNLRTYVRHGDRPGVYFMRIEAAKVISVALARTLSVLPYRHSKITRRRSEDDSRSFDVSSVAAHWALRYRIGAPIDQVSTLDTWLTERYCLYQSARGHLHCYQVHHRPWLLNNVKVIDPPHLDQWHELQLDTVTSAHYSSGVEVVSWSNEIVN
jgi:uncharacterized protein